MFGGLGHQHDIFACNCGVVAIYGVRHSILPIGFGVHCFVATFSWRHNRQEFFPGCDCITTAPLPVKPDSGNVIISETKRISTSMGPKNPLDKLWVLWAICLIKHYNEIGKPTSPNNISNEFGESNWRAFRTACEMADHYRLLHQPTMQLTPRGLAACQDWERISARAFRF